MSGTAALVAGLAAGYAQAKRQKRMDDVTTDYRAKQGKLMDAQIAALQPKSEPKGSSSWESEYQALKDKEEYSNVEPPIGFADGGLVTMPFEAPSLMSPQSSDWQRRSFKKGCCGMCGGKHDGQC